MTGPHITAETPLVTVWRVTWSADWWKPTTQPKTRSFRRRSDACRVALRLYGEGYNVTVDTAQRTQWENVNFDAWIVGDDGVIA